MQGDSTFKAGMGPGPCEEVREQHLFYWDSPESHCRNGLCMRSCVFLSLILVSLGSEVLPSSLSSISKDAKRKRQHSQCRFCRGRE